MTNKLNMMIHCGAEYTPDVDAVRNVITPPKTGSWHPIPHHYLINEVQKRIEEAGLQIVAESHALTAKGAKGKAGDGSRYFGMMQVEPANIIERNDDFSFVVGLRNSHDKAFAAGLVLGTGCFVCDNLCFSGEIKLARRHTVNIMRDLPNVINRAVSRLVESRTAEVDRVNTYKTTEFSKLEASDALIQLLKSKAFPKIKIDEVIEQWETPNHPEFQPRTAWSMFNAVTEVLKSTSIMMLPDRTTKLNAAMDTICGLTTDQNLAQRIEQDLNQDGVIDAEYTVKS